MYRLRATVLINQVESSPSKLILVNTKEAAAKSPAIQSVNVLVNGSAIFQFIPAEDADVNYTLEYREVSSPDPTWTGFEFESDSSNEVLLTGLLPNRTYEARLFANGNVVHGHRSRTVPFHTNNTAQLPEISLDPEEEIVLDPDVSLPLEVNCHVVSSPPSNIHWLVDGQPIQAEHSFYAVTNSPVDDKKTTSSIHIKSRTRNDNLTCVAVNPAGRVSSSVAVRIRGPGSPPSAVTLQSERGGYTVSWAPPTHPNGNITKYVVYHSSNKEDPLSDWQKLVLDGTENTVRILSEAEDAFYVRVQAAADSGPGVISDIVAIEKDTVPISVSLHYEDPPDREHLLIEPGEKSYELLLNEDVSEDAEYWQKYLTTTRDNSVPMTRLSLPTEQLKPSYQYYVRVRAINQAGAGPLSEPIQFTTPNGGRSYLCPENPPSQVSVDINEANIAVLRWSKPNCTTEILNYVIYFTRDLGISNEDYREWQTVEVPATETQFKFDHQVGLKPKTFYRVRVSAKNDVAEGPVSETKEFETAHSELPIPTDIRTSVAEDNTLTITFSAVRDPDDHSNAIQRYKIELAQSDDVLTANWHPVNASSSSIDDMTSQANSTPLLSRSNLGQVTIGIDGSRLARSSMYWVKITASLNNPARFVQASKPRWFRTGDGRLRTRAEIEGGPVVEKEPNLFETLRLVCRAEGSPLPEVTWYWNDDPIESEKEGWTVEQEQSERVTVSVEQDLSTLTRSSVRESGIALCAAGNEDSNATAQVEVRVLGPGSAPREVRAVGWRNQINVTWQEPLIPNGLIMKYIIYYALRDAADLSDWEKLETDVTEIQVPAMSPETRYLVRVQAATADGPGIISDSVECFSDKHYQAIVVNLVSTNVDNFEAEPNQTVVLRCSAQGQPIPRIFYAWDDHQENEITDVLITESTFHISGLFERSALTNQTLICRAENKHESVDVRRVLIIRKPGDVPTNITWSFDENDSLFIDWSRIRYPNGNV
ncbi:fibronectin type III domain protein, partial [Ancylostoma duodenale]